MSDREKVIKEIEELLNGYPVFIPEAAKRGLSDALALIKEQEDLGTELTNAVELIHKKNERIEKLLKEQEEKPLRCKTCTMRDKTGFCHRWNKEVKDDDYCSFGAWKGC